MDDSLVKIFGYAFHGLYAKAIFLSLLAIIFTFGRTVGHTMGVNEAIDKFQAMLDKKN